MARVAWRSDVRRLPAGSAGRNGAERSNVEALKMRFVPPCGTKGWQVLALRISFFEFRFSFFGRYSLARHALSQVMGAVLNSEQAVTSEASTAPNVGSL